MSLSISTTGILVLFLTTISFSPLLVQPSRVLLAESQDNQLQKSDTPIFRPPNDAENADFKAWVSRVGEKFRIKSSSQPTSLNSEDSSLDDAVNLDGPTYIVVDQNGNGQFSKVQDAIDSIQRDQKRTQRITIQINPGHYSEKIIIAKNLPYLTLQGGGMYNTLIEHAETAEQAGSDIADATVAISAPNFIARNITFQNSSPAPPSGAVGKQATAVYISGDMGAFYGCGFLGAQDTLYDHNGRHYFEECYIEGSIDFIYGDGKSLYKNCQLNVIPVSTGSLTAQKRTSGDEETGFSFVDCAVTGAGRVYLGRAWGRYSRVVFATTWLADIVIPQGWQDWSDPSRQETVYYGEYNCFGPGANSDGRAGWSHQLSYSEAEPFLTPSYIDGEYWLYN